MSAHQDDIKQQVGALIRDARKEKGITQKEAGQLLGISESAYNRYEKGDRNVSVEVLASIAEALGCHIEIQFKKA